MTTKSLVNIGKAAPSFSLLNQDGEKVALKDFRGKSHVVVYFYPKASTPGCTVQAIGLRDSAKKLAKLNTVVLGLSPDQPEKLAKFAEKEDLNFLLLSDPLHQIAEKYGVWGMKKNYGKEYYGIIRTTFIVGSDGLVKHIMDKVKTKTHHDDVLDWIKKNLN